MRKKGHVNIFIPIGILLLVIVFVITFLIYFQVSTIINSVKKELFYIANNALIAMDEEALAYNDYNIDLNKMRYIIQNLLDRNKQRNVNRVSIMDLRFNSNNKKPHLYIKVKVEFKPIVNIFSKESYSFKLQDEVMIALLNYNSGAKNEE